MEERVTRTGAVLFLLVAVAAAQSIDAAGTIETDTTWAGQVFLLEDVIVARGVTLTIEPGTRIVVDSKVRGRGPGWNPERLELHVAGRIVARGRPDNPIQFGCPPKGKIRDAEERCWLGLVLLPERTTRSEFTWCSFEAADAGLQIAGALVRLDHCVIRNCTSGIASMLRADRGRLGALGVEASAPVLRSSVISGCLTAVVVERDARPDLEQCVIVDCTFGIASFGFGELFYPATGIGPRVHRSEFIRCDVAVRGSARVTSSIFEKNELVYVPSNAHRNYASTTDRYLRSHNQYWGNQTISKGGVPLGANNIFVAPVRRGLLPAKEKLDSLALLCAGLEKVLALQPKSPGLGAGRSGGDIGAFGARTGAARVSPLAVARVSGLVVNTWVMCGPPGLDSAGSRKRLVERSKPGDVAGDATWVLVRNTDRPVAHPGGELTVDTEHARALTAYIDSPAEVQVRLAIAVDGLCVVGWNRKELAERWTDGCVFGDEWVLPVTLRKGRNQLSLIVLPNRKDARLRVRLVTDDGRVPEGIVNVTPSPRSNKRLRVITLKWDQKGQSRLAIKFSVPLHWKDAVKWKNYRLIGPDGEFQPLKGRDIQYLAQERTVVITGFELVGGKGRYRLVVGSLTDVFGARRNVAVPRSVSVRVR